VIDGASGQLTAAQTTLRRIEELQARIGVGSDASLGRDIDRVRAAIAQVNEG